MTDKTKPAAEPVARTAPSVVAKPEAEALELLHRAVTLLEQAASGKGKHAEAFGFLANEISGRATQLESRVK